MAVKETALSRLLLMMILATVPLAAELIHVELALGGIECASCAQSVDRVFKRIKGVDTATFRTQDSVVALDLRPDNTVTLEQLRDAAKGMGYTPGAAKVTARGQAREDGGKWLFRLTGSDAEYRLETAVDATSVSIVEGSIAGLGAPLKVTKTRGQ